MKNLLATIVALLLATAVMAQEQSAPTLSSTMEVYVFPTEGQDAKQQSMDEATCYDWAAANTGSDPFNLAKEAEANEELAAAEMEAAEATGQGSGARTAVRGAAAGALVAEVSGGDTSEGAAIGATAGVIRGRRQGRAAQQQATEQAEAQADDREEANEEDRVNFMNAFSVCLEAKEYMVKY